LEETGYTPALPEDHQEETGPKKEKENPPIIMRDIIISFLEAAAYLNKRVQHLYYRFYST
jgi:hypothetical protein